MAGVSLLFPRVFARLQGCSKELAALNLPPYLALSRKYRRALEVCHLNLVPAEVLDKLDTVVDVGANVGWWSIGVALLTKARQILAFEPVPEVFSALRDNTRKFPHIRCFDCALGSSEGELPITVENATELSSLLPLCQEVRAMHHARAEESRRVHVKIGTLDTQLKDVEEISLLKLDVQGYELEALRGGRDTLQRTNAVLTEIQYFPYYHGGSDFDSLYRLITALGPFRLWGISEPHCAPGGRPLWADAVFVRT